MELKDMSSEMLLFTYSNLLSQKDQIYAQIKEMDKEIASRNDLLRQRYRDGKIKPERDVEE